MLLLGHRTALEPGATFLLMMATRASSERIDLPARSGASPLLACLWQVAARLLGRKDRAGSAR